MARKAPLYFGQKNPVFLDFLFACLFTSVLGPERDGGLGPDALEVLGRQADDVVGVFCQVANRVVLKRKKELVTAKKERKLSGKKWQIPK